MTVCGDIRVYFERNNVPVEFALYSHYDALVRALHNGQSNIAWNSPLAHGRFCLLSGGKARPWLCGTWTAVTAASSSSTRIRASPGWRTWRARPWSWAAGIPPRQRSCRPISSRKRESISARSRFSAFTRKWTRAAAPVAANTTFFRLCKRAEARPGSSVSFSGTRLSTEKPAELSQFKDVWTSPSFSHCVFTARKDFDRELAARFTRLMLAMDGKDAVTAEILRLEQAAKWVPGTHEGFEDLLQRLREQANPAPPAKVMPPQVAEGKAPENKEVNDKIKEIAGRAEVLKSLRKHFATLKGVDAARTASLVLGGRDVPKISDLTPDGEVKRSGWWARLDQMTIGDRVWVGFKMDRDQEPTAVLMICDELSEQDIHGQGPHPGSRRCQDGDRQASKGASRMLQTEGAEVNRRLRSVTRCTSRVAGDRARLILDRGRLRSRRRTRSRRPPAPAPLDRGGLPGTIRSWTSAARWNSCSTTRRCAGADPSSRATRSP